MLLNDQSLYLEVLGCLINNPALIESQQGKVVIDDFDKKCEGVRVLAFAVLNMITQGVTTITSDTINSYLQSYPTLLHKYNTNNGPDLVTQAIEVGQVENYEFFLKRLKKNSLLLDLRNHGYDVSPYDISQASNDFPGTKQEAEVIERYEAATQEEILSYVEKGFTEVKQRHDVSTQNQKHAGDDIRDILSSLQQAPEQGAELCGEIYNSVVRGALLGKMYLRSAPSNVGKTRLSVFDACSIAYPIKYSLQNNCFVWQRDKEPQKILFITTEMVAEEIQTIILAYLSGVEEKRIKRNTLTSDEYNRVENAAKIMEKYNKYFLLEEINDPNLVNVESTIKKHIILDNTKYIFYDYIFTSPSLASGFGGLREDVTLMMLSNQLKEIAKTYGVFIQTSSQVNGDGYKTEDFLDARVLRGSKAIADKIDVGCVITEVTPEELEEMGSIFQQNGVPTHAIDIYKMRGGPYKNVRLWCKIDMGTGERRDFFMTDKNKTVREMDNDDLVPKLKEYNVQNVEETLNKIQLEEEKVLPDPIVYVKSEVTPEVIRPSAKTFSEVKVNKSTQAADSNKFGNEWDEFF